MTDTETLVDVLRGLAGSCPDRFQVGKVDGYFYVHRWGQWRKATLIARLDEDRIVGACQEECEARGWFWSLSWDLDDDDNLEYDGQVWWDEGMLDRYPYRAFRPSPALAIATALRDALEATK